jgi:hypothetical protein
MFKAICNSRTGVRLGKLPVLRRNLFCRCCNFKRWVSAARKTEKMLGACIICGPCRRYIGRSIEGARIKTLPKPAKDPKFPQNLSPISVLSNTGKLFVKLFLRTIQKHVEERNVLHASQFVFRADHSTTLQCTRLAYHITLNFNNNMSTAAAFLNIEKAFDITWHSGLLYSCQN